MVVSSFASVNFLHFRFLSKTVKDSKKCSKASFLVSKVVRIPIKYSDVPKKVVCFLKRERARLQLSVHLFPCTRHPTPSS